MVRGMALSAVAAVAKGEVVRTEVEALARVLRVFRQVDGARTALPRLRHQLIPVGCSEALTATSTPVHTRATAPAGNGHRLVKGRKLKPARNELRGERLSLAGTIRCPRRESNSHGVAPGGF